MISLTSDAAQKAYKQFQAMRVRQFDYEHATRELFNQMTKANTDAINACAEDILNGVHIKEESADGVPVVEYNMFDAKPGKYIYYIHGGGFVHGEAAWGNYCAVKIAQQTKRNIVAVNYRLAPDNPFPAAPEDCITVYKWMLSKGIKAKDIVLLGESSGGNLVLAVTWGAKDRGIPLPAGVAAISPVVNLMFDFPSYTGRIDRECILPYNQDRFAQYCYMRDKDLKNPLASPYYGDCTGFPPVFLGVSTEESLFDDSIKMHEKLLKEGVDSTLKVWEGMWHTFYMMDFPESNVVFEQVSQFMDGLAKASGGHPMPAAPKTKAKGAANSKQEASAVKSKQETSVAKNKQDTAVAKSKQDK